MQQKLSYRRFILGSFPSMEFFKKNNGVKEILQIGHISVSEGGIKKIIFNQETDGALLVNKKFNSDGLIEREKEQISSDEFFDLFGNIIGAEINFERWIVKIQNFVYRFDKITKANIQQSKKYLLKVYLIDSKLNYLMDGFSLPKGHSFFEDAIEITKDESFSTFNLTQSFFKDKIKVAFYF